MAGERRKREELGCAGRTANKGRFGMTGRGMERERNEDSENNNAIKMNNNKKWVISGKSCLGKEVEKEHYRV